MKVKLFEETKLVIGISAVAIQNSDFIYILFYILQRSFSHHSVKILHVKSDKKSNSFQKFVT